MKQSRVRQNNIARKRKKFAPPPTSHAISSAVMRCDGSPTAMIGSLTISNALPPGQSATLRTKQPAVRLSVSLSDEMSIDSHVLRIKINPLRRSCVGGGE